MIEYIGNCDIIDWQQLITELENQEPAYIGPKHRIGTNVPGVDEVGIPLINAGYKEGGSMQWDMFLPKINFDNTLIQKFMNYVGMKSCYNAWISRIRPGYMAPWHWDVTDDEDTLTTHKEIVRYHTHISKPAPGHVFVVEDVCLYNQQQGAVWKWPNRKSWHTGSNSGLGPKYIFNIWG